jgi:hypothetical protein
MNEDTIKKLKDNRDFKEFQAWIIEKISDMDSVEGLSLLSNDAAGEEAKVRQKTKEKLIEILSPVLNLPEPKEPSIEEVQRAKNRYGL